MNFKESFKINSTKLTNLIIAEALFYISIFLYPALLVKIFSSIFENLGERLQAINSTESIQQLMAAQTSMQSMLVGLIFFILLLFIGLLLITAFTSYLAYLIQFNKKICCERKYLRYLLNYFIFIIFSSLILIILLAISQIFNVYLIAIIMFFVVVLLGYFKIFFMSSTLLSIKKRDAFKNLRYMFTKESYKVTFFAFLIFVAVGFIFNLFALIPIPWLTQIIFYILFSLYIIWARNYLGETFREQLKTHIKKSYVKKEIIKKRVSKNRTIKKKSVKKKPKQIKKRK